MALNTGDPGQLEFHLIDSDTPVGSFVCSGGVGRLDLEEFLREEALSVQEQQIANTVVAQLEDAVVGYVTLGLDSILLEYQDAMKVGIDSHIGNNIPAVRIYQLAVAEGCQRMGIGSTLMRHVFQVVASVRQVIPCPQMIVVAYEDAVDFYRRFGFEVASARAQWHSREQCKFMIAALDRDV